MESAETDIASFFKNVFSRNQIPKFVVGIFALCLLFLEVYNCFNINRNAQSTVEIRKESYDGPMGSCIASKALDHTYMISLCAVYDGFVIDIRQFLRSVTDGHLTPTLKGITLKQNQWEQIIASANWLQKELKLAHGERSS
jgi:uncharacterized membrane protein (Fun14 family)